MELDPKMMFGDIKADHPRVLQSEEEGAPAFRRESLCTDTLGIEKQK
jgi:hypothetical protein